MPNHRPEYPLLAIDTSSRRIWVGLKLDAGNLHSLHSDEDATRSLFKLTSEILEQADLSLFDLQQIVFCQGPGSMLGARTAAITLRSWNAIGVAAAAAPFSYKSLDLGAMLAQNLFGSGATGLVLTDARRNSWHTRSFPIDSGEERIEILPNELLENRSDTLVTFPEFIRWTKSSAPLREVRYDPTPIFQQEAFTRITFSEDIATPFAIRQSDFKKWMPKIHGTSEG